MRTSGRRIFFQPVFCQGREGLPDIVCGKDCGAGIGADALKGTPLKGSGKEYRVQSHNRVYVCGDEGAGQDNSSVDPQGKMAVASTTAVI